MNNKILGLSSALLLGLLTACPQPVVTPIAAPQNILTIPDDKNVTVIWDAVQDSRVTGYNVYQDGVKVNTSLIPASARITLQSEAGLGGRYRFTVPNVLNLAKFTVRAFGSIGEGLPTPDTSSRPVVCSRYTVKGTNMGGLAQNISLKRGATVLSSATARVNGTNIPFSAGTNLFQGNLAAAVAVGANVELVTADGDCLVYARDTLPESAVVTTPAAAANVAASAVLPVTWTSATNPDRFVVAATWVVGATGFGYRSADLPSTARSFDLPANTLPGGTNVKIRVYAYNDGTETFIGAFETGSQLAIRNGDEAGKDITTTQALPGVSWGDPHLVTFDQTGVEFQAVGEFDLAYSVDNNLKIQARQLPWGGSTAVSINTAIATRMNGQKVGLYVSPVGVSPLRVGDTGVRTGVPSGGLDLGAGFSIQQLGSTYTLRYPSGDKVEVDVGSYINLRAYPASTRASTMRGLLGNWDGNTTNDIFKRDGSTVTPLDFTNFYGAYANSWRIPAAADSLFVYDAGQSFGGFDDTSFPSNVPVITDAARAAATATCAGVAANNLENCIKDVAITGDNSFADAARAVQNPVALLAPALPDLKITTVNLSLGSVCRPYNMFVTASISVQNIGNASSPNIPNFGSVQLVDARDEGLGAGYRGNGVEIPALAAGATANVTVNVFYPISTPQDTEGTRDYIARVDFGNRIIESDESNNRLGGLSINIPATFCKNRVALIHGVDSSAATAYQTGLTTKGLRVSLLAISGLNANSAVTLSAYDLLVIDTNTGNLNTWEGSADVQTAIRNAGRPLLGIGEGGYAYLGKFNSPIGWSNAWHIPTGATTFAIPSPAHPSNSGLFAISSSAGSVTVSSSNMPFLAINLPPTVATNLQLVARQSDDVTHYISVLNTTPTATTGKGSTEAIWGFKGTPSYTDNGWNALANLGWFMLP